RAFYCRWVNPTATSSQSTKTATSSKICKIRPRPTRKQPAPPKRPTASISIASTRAASVGFREERGNEPAPSAARRRRDRHRRNAGRCLGRRLRSAQHSRTTKTHAQLVRGRTHGLRTLCNRSRTLLLVLERHHELRGRQNHERAEHARRRTAR